MVNAHLISGPWISICSSIRSTGTFREDFQRVFTIYGHGAHLGHVTRIMLISFHFHVPKSNLVKIGPVVSEKSKF